LNSADFAGLTNELTLLLRGRAESVPFDEVDWSGLLARIEAALALEAPDFANASPRRLLEAEGDVTPSRTG
jgi:hypothetical protein